MAQSITQRIALTGGAEIKKELEALGRDGEAAFRKLQVAAAALKGPGTDFAASMRSAAASLTTVGKVFIDAGRNIERVGKSLSTFITAPLVGVGTIAVKTFSDFESGMAAVGNQIDLTKESLVGIGDELRNFASHTPIALNDIVKAFGEIRSSGITAADGMKVLAGSARLAVASSTDIATAADVATSAINAFGLKGADQAKVFDLLFRATDGGKVSLQALGESFGKIANTLRSSKIQLDEYLLAISALSRGGLDATAAQRDLNSIIDKFSSGSKEVTEILHKLGANSFPELITKSGGFVQALQKMVASAHGSTSELNKLFGSAQAVGAVLALTGPQFASFTQDLNEQRSGVEKLSSAYERMRDTTKAGFVELRNQLSNAAIDIGTDLLPQVKAMVAGIESVVKAFHDLSPATKDSIIKFAEVVAIIGPLIFIGGKLVTVIGAISTASGFLLSALIPLGAAIAALSAPVLIVIGVLAALVIGIVVLNNTFGTGVKHTNEHKQALVELQKAMEAVRAGVPGSVEALKRVGDEHLANAKKAIIDANAELEAARKKLGADQERAARTRPGVFDNALKRDEHEVNKQLADLQASQKELSDFTKQMNSDIAESNAIVGNSATSAVAAISKTTDAVQSSVTVIRGGARDAAGNVRGLTKEVVDLTNGVNANLSDVGKNLGKVGDGAKSILTPITGLNDAIKSTGDGVLRITDSTGKVLLEVDQTVGGIGQAIDKVTESVAQLGSTGQELAQATNLTAVADGANQVVTALQSASAQAQSVAQVITDAATQASAAWNALPASIVAAAGSASGAAAQIVAAFASVTSQVEASLASLGPTLQAAFSGAVAAITSQLDSLASSVASLVGSMVSQLNSLASAIVSAQAALASAQAAQGKAAGGAIRGPGTGTSDSILARISNGEFVIRASAVRHYGERLFEALNSMRFPRGFDVGGMVAAATAGMRSSRSVPAFAGGGRVSAGRPINLHIDGQTFAMTAPEDTASSLNKYAMNRRARSAGRKPNWNQP